MARSSRRERAAWQASRRTEQRYGSALRRLVAQITDLIRAGGTAAQISDRLLRYSNTIKPWADAITTRMLREVDMRDTKTWERITKEMGIALRAEIKNAPTGIAMRQLHGEEVDLITSLPRQAAERVQERAQEMVSEGLRFDEMAAEISGVTRNRARLIARTEIAKAHSTLLQARAEYVGCDEYIWRTARDSDVRDSHQEMEGRVIRWDTPPVVDEGVPPYHAGRIYNCRCYPEPIIPRRIT